MYEVVVGHDDDVDFICKSQNFFEKKREECDIFSEEFDIHDHHECPTLHMLRVTWKKCCIYEFGIRVNRCYMPKFWCSEQVLIELLEWVVFTKNLFMFLSVKRPHQGNF